MTSTLTRPCSDPPRPTRITPDDAGEAARYISQMTGEMVLLARSARLDLLAYFLEMARIEAQTLVIADNK
jgi:hypothetical protein